MNWYDVLHLDRLFVQTGVYSDPNTTWTLDVDDETIDTIVLGPCFDDYGAIKTPDDVTGDTVTLAGDWSTDDVALGRSFTWSVELTRPYVRDQLGNADVNAVTIVRHVAVTHRNTGYLKVRSAMHNRDDRSVILDRDPVDQRGVLTASLNGNAEDQRIFLESDDARPVSVSAVEWLVTYQPRRR